MSVRRFFSCFFRQPLSFVLFTQDFEENGLLKNSSSTDDLSLIRRIAAGNEHAFEQLYDRYERLVYCLVYRMLEDHGQAEDVTLEVFSRLWQHADSYLASQGSVKTWLVNIARNRAIDLLRMRRTKLDGNHSLWADDELEKLVAKENPERMATRADMHQRLLSALQELPEEQRAALALAYLKGLSHSQIADQLNEPLGTIKGRIRSAMRNLQDKFATHE